MAMHQHLASVHYKKSERSGGICATAVLGHADCPPTTTCLLREARKFVRERGQPAPAAVLPTPPLPVAALSSTSQPPTAEPGPTTSELRDLLIQANETNKALTARLDVLAADAAKRNKKAHRHRDPSPTQYQDHKRSSRSRDDRKRSSRSRDARKRSSRSRDSRSGDESFRSEGFRQRGATPADDFYRRWAQDIEQKQLDDTAKAEEAHIHITYVCSNLDTHTHNDTY